MKKTIILFCLLVFFLLLSITILLRNPVLSSFDAARSEHISIDENYLRYCVASLTKHEVPRNFSNLVALNRSADFIHSELKKTTPRVFEQRYMVANREYKNLIASFGSNEGERIIVGAHYDVFDNQPGADDNASGVAGLLELARLLAAETQELHHPIDLIAYTLEEPPYFRTSSMGSAKHADSLWKAKINIKAMICLETIGYYSDAEGSQQYPHSLLKALYPSQGNFIAVVGKYSSFSLVRSIKNSMSQVSETAVYSINAPASIPGIDFSDHLNYWKHGYNAIMITNTAFYRNSNYHESTDTMETLNFTRMGNVIKGVYWSVINLE